MSRSRFAVLCCAAHRSFRLPRRAGPAAVAAGTDVGPGWQRPQADDFPFSALSSLVVPDTCETGILSKPLDRPVLQQTIIPLTKAANAGYISGPGWRVPPAVIGRHFRQRFTLVRTKMPTGIPQWDTVHYLGRGWNPKELMHPLFHLGMQCGNGPANAQSAGGQQQV